MKNKYDQLIDSYLDGQIGLGEAFLPEELSTGLRENLLRLHHDGSMFPAGTGNKLQKDPDQKMRSDKIYWLDKSHNNVYENQFLEHIEAFIERLNSTCYTGINSYEFHYAVYEEGSFYKRHKDQFRNDDKRKFSLIHYLNTDWLETDGGQLLVYRDDEVRRIQPCSRTAVFFKSDETEHEVVPASRSRLSITGWLKQV